MRFPPLGRHCTAVETTATTRASDKLSSRAANNMNGRFTDIFPFKPGKVTFSLDAAIERNRKQAKRTRSADSHRANPNPSRARAQIATRPTNILAEFGVRFMVFISLFSLLLSYSTVQTTAPASSTSQSPPSTSLKASLEALKLPQSTLSPHRTLKPVCVESPQITLSPQSTDEPLTRAESPQITDLPHTIESP